MSSDSPLEEISVEPPVVDPPKAISEWSAQRWQATLAHFEVSLGRATYKSHLGGIRLIEVMKRDNGEVFVVTVPNQYAREWIERHFLPSLERVLSDWNRKPTRVQIEVEGPPGEPRTVFVAVTGKFSPCGCWQAMAQRWLVRARCRQNSR